MASEVISHMLCFYAVAYIVLNFENKLFYVPTRKSDLQMFVTHVCAF